MTETKNEKKKRGRPANSGYLDDQIKIRMNHEVKVEMQNVIKECDISQSDFIRIAVREKLDRMKEAKNTSTDGDYDSPSDDYWSN